MFFDKYIIKREFIGGIDRWSLKRLKWYPGNKVSYVNTFGNADNDFDEDNRSILMLLSMFHVSNPTLVYKHWLNGALNYVRSNGNFNEAIKYKLYLINLAKSFVFDRFLNKSAPLDYYEIIYRTNKDVKRNKKMLDENKLRYGAIENNLIFNYLDYLLWEKYNQEKEIKKYEFSFRSSVEHYYPRHPMPGYKKLNDDCLDSFGNLCLISHSKNSRLNNQPPIAKCSHYKKQSLDSIKQWVMMNDYKPDDWGEVSISDHYEKMIKVLTGDMDSLYEDLITFGTEANTRNNNAEHWFDLYKNDTENKKILARALMCFGDIATDAGYSNYRESWHHKYYLYEWDKINTLPAFSQYQKYIKDYNPGSLSSLIKDNLENNKSLLKDPYRYAFVKYPEFWEYCDRGYFTWVDNGASILLHSGEKNTGNTSLDLIIFLLWKWVEKYYCNEVNYWREGIGVSIDINETFKFVERDGGKGKLFIHCEDYGKIKCYVQPNKNSANSSFVRLLGDFGWQNYEDRQYQKGNTSTIVMLTHDYEEDYNKAIEKLTLIFKNGLGIKI
jgi:hypothetical protein